MLPRVALVLVSVSLISLTICYAQETCSDPTCPSVGEDEVESGLTLLPAPENCNEFFICSHGTAIRMFCPATLVFNPAINVCDYERNSKCTPCQLPEDEKEDEGEEE
ncbi:peritrophin-1-like [Phlebotomus argentipes]|uniref:peritrophin-1-like n=1 Tax=Phlebotomus argentipes TaxID=94469 RepID=UPI0028930D86|nr:peritrophin-1-like [Phlebotomus argentipes]